MGTVEGAVAFVNNPGVSNAGKKYYSLKLQADPKIAYWAEPGQLDGLNKGDMVRLAFDARNNIKTLERVTSSAGAQIKSYRQDESPSVVDGKCIHGLVTAFAHAGLIALDADEIARAYKICADGYHRKGSLASVRVQSTPRPFGEPIDEILF